jgi:hypothetical protein
MRFPLFRSRAFWFGLPTLLFLLWAWEDSTRTNTLLMGKGPWGSFSFEHRDSAIEVCRAPVGSPFPFPDHWFRGQYMTKEPVDPAPRIWWPAVKAERDSVGRPFIRTPHWLLVLTYLAAWTLVIAFRRRHWMKARRTGAAQLTTS